MRFTFPKNYRYQAKILGFIDYLTAIIDLIIGIFLFLLLKILIHKIATRIYIFIVLYLPVVLFSIVVAGDENIVRYTMIIISFLKRRGIYFYEKKY